MDTLIGKVKLFHRFFLDLTNGVLNVFIFLVFIALNLIRGVLLLVHEIVRLKFGVYALGLCLQRL